jgi:ribosomal protein S18 acetylase RimI-like enzyme
LQPHAKTQVPHFVRDDKWQNLAGGTAALVNSFQIRRAAVDDGEAILACLASAFAPYRDRYTPKGFADTVLDSSTVQERIGEMSVFVAVAEGTIVGTIGCKANGEEGHLRGMAVSPQWQGTSVASSLLEAAEAELRRAGCKLVTLDTTRPLERAIRFYQRQGFVASERIADFFGMELFEYTKKL